MRKIKQRAWDLKENKHTYSDKVTPEYWGDAILARCPAWGKCEFGGDLILEEWTGLADKNGVEAYEGDIILSENIFMEKFPLEVVFDRGVFCGVIDRKYSPKGIRNLYDQPFKVIGNIHENPLDYRDCRA